MNSRELLQLNLVQDVQDVLRLIYNIPTKILSPLINIKKQQLQLKLLKGKILLILPKLFYLIYIFSCENN